jgi:hypothetical protein
MFPDLKFHSHEQQDEFVFNVLDQKTDGFFLDVACGHPLIGSNTYTLEKYLNWTGFCFDIVDAESQHQWSSKRTAKFLNIDATSDSFRDFLKNNIPKNTIIDYISLDIDFTNTVVALKKIIDAGVEFKTMTFEHEICNWGPQQRDESREILTGLGTVRLFEDVRHPTFLLPDPSASSAFEDWWIHPKYIDPAILTIGTTEWFYRDNVQLLKEYKNQNYNYPHVCCQSWLEEYSLFWHKTEEIQYKEKFKLWANRK